MRANRRTGFCVHVSCCARDNLYGYGHMTTLFQYGCVLESKRQKPTPCFIIMYA